MKRLFGVPIALLLVAVIATPAFAQGPIPPGRMGELCFGGNETVKADPNYTPEYVTAFGCNVTLEQGARVSGDVAVFGGNVSLQQGSQVTGDAVVFGGNVNVAGEVTRDVSVFGGNITLEPTAVVGRDVLAFGGNVSQSAGAIVRGRTTFGNRFSGFPFSGNWSSAFPIALGGGLVGAMTGVAFGFVRSIIYAIALAALGALTVVFLPAQTKQVSDTAQNSALPSLGVGCLTLLVALPLFILLIILIITIPIALLLPLALIVAWLFGWIALGQLAGEKIMEAFKAREILPVVAVIVGIIALALVGAVPLIGWLVSLVVGSIGLGAVVLTRFGTRQYPPLAPVAAALAAPSAPAPAAPSSDVSASS